MISDILKQKGFNQLFPFVEAFSKDNIHVNICYQMKRNDVFEDTDRSSIFGIKVTKFDLPKVTVKIFRNESNAIEYILKH